MWWAGRCERFAPRAPSFVRAVFVNQLVEKWKRANKWKLVPETQQALPNHERRLHFVNRSEEIQRLQIGVRVRRKRAVEEFFHVLIRSPRPRYHQRHERWIDAGSSPKLHVSFRGLLLTQQEVSAVKGNLGGSRVDRFSLPERISGARIVARRLIRAR